MTRDKFIFTTPDNQSDSYIISPKNFRIGIHNFEFNNFTQNFKKKLETSYFQGTPFLENFSFNEISTWWLFHERFFYTVKPYIDFIVLFERFIEKHNPKTIVIKDNFEFYKLIKQICINHNIKFKYNKINVIKYSLKNKLIKISRNIIRRYRLSKLTKNRIKNNLFQFKNKFQNDVSIKNKIIFATSVTYRRNLFNFNTRLFDRADYLTNELMQFFENPEKIIGLSLPYTTNRTFDLIYQERLLERMIWIPEEQFLTDSSIPISKFLKKYNHLINLKEFQELFVYNGINFWDSICEMFSQMTFPPYLPYWLSLYQGYCKKFEFEKPHSIFMTSEIDPQNLILISACKKFDIPTIALQQGFFSYSGPPGFFHDPNLHLHKFAYPFPSKYFVWGKISKKILIELGWPESNLVNFGHPYYYNLDDMIELVRNPPYSKYNVDSSKKIILFPTTEMQSMYLFPGYHYDTVVWKYLLENFGSAENFIIILKPHPHEQISEYEQILDKSHSKNAFIIQDNLQELFSISDIIVCNHSTVILDAICMKKTVLALKWDDIDENLDQYTSLIESIDINDLKSKIYSKLENNVFDEKIWLQTMNDFFNFPMNEAFVKELIQKNTSPN